MSSFDFIMCGETQETYASSCLVGYYRRLANRFPTAAFLSSCPRSSLGYPCGFRSSNSFPCPLGRKGLQLLDWSADYRLHARAAWQPQDLFQPILDKARPFCRGRYACVAVDDTRLHKTGRRICSAFFQRDPLSPKFRFNLMFGLRFLQMSLLTPLYRTGKQSARALPVRFEEVPAVKKPGRKASAQEWATWRQHCKLHNLSTRTVEILRGLRSSLDASGYADQTLLAVCDNSFCNRTVFRAEWTRTSVIARARRDVKLCRRATEAGQRFYDVVKFTPKLVYDDPSILWQKARIFHGGQWRKVRYKQLAAVYWQGGAGRKPLRLLVVVAGFPIRCRGGNARVMATRLPADHRPKGHPAGVTAGLLRPLANRGQPSRRKGHLRCRSGPASLRPFRPSTASLSRGSLQCTTVSRAPRLRCRSRGRLSRPAEVAQKGKTPVLPGPDHATPQRNGREPSLVGAARLASGLEDSWFGSRSIKKYVQSPGTGLPACPFR